MMTFQEGVTVMQQGSFQPLFKKEKRKKEPMSYQFGSLVGKHSTCETPF